MEARRLPRILFAMALIGVAALTGCAGSSTGEIDNPVLRRATWIDFISAGDIRRTCDAGSPGRIRFVLNANRAEQVRIYDLSIADASLRTRVLTPKLPINEIQLNDSITRFFNPTDMIVRLSESDAGAILAAYRADLAAPRSAAPTDLLSEWHFWLVGACLDGVFDYEACVSPDPGFRALAFPAPLLAGDVTGIPLNRPPAGPRLTLLDYNPARQQGFDHYILHLRDNRVILGQNYGQDRSQ